MSARPRIYLDANATVPPLPDVVDAVASAMRSGMGNPASAHQAGAEGRRAVEGAREKVSGLVDDAFAENIVFMSGGTEANNTVLRHFEAWTASCFSRRASSTRPC